jgi:hypothetical protein
MLPAHITVGAEARLANVKAINNTSDLQVTTLRISGSQHQHAECAPSALASARCTCVSCALHLCINLQRALLSCIM